MAATYCPSCGHQTLKFLRKSVFGQSVFDCTNCNQISIMRINPTDVDEKDEKQQEEQKLQKKIEEMLGKATEKVINEAIEMAEEAGDESVAEQFAEMLASTNPNPVGRNQPLAGMSEDEPGEEGAGGMSVGTLDQKLAEHLKQTDPTKSYNESFREQMKLNTFYQKVGNVMRDNQFDRLEDNQRRGRLTVRNLFKVHTGSEKVFSRKLARKNKKYAVVILLDESGSMNGSRMSLAAASTIALIRGLVRHHIRFSVIGFNEIVTVHKRLGSHLNEQKLDDLHADILRSAASENRGNTFTYAGCLEVERQLRYVEEGEQAITVIITDGGAYKDEHWIKNRAGQDVGSSSGWNEATQEHELDGEVARLEKYGPVVTVGLFEKTEIKQWFPKAKVIQDLSDFTDTILTEFGKVVIRG